MKFLVLSLQFLGLTYVVYSYQLPLDRKFRLQRVKLAGEEIPDPLDFVKGSDKLPSSSTPSLSSNQRKMSKKRYVEKKTDQIEELYSLELLETVEAEMLQSLPLEMLESFQSYCASYVPRISIMAFVLHVMLLIPTLRYVKLELHQSIYPFLYLSPLVVLGPFAVFFGYEKALYESEFIERRVRAYLMTQKEYSVKFVESEEGRLLETLEDILREGGGTAAIKVTKNIALARLMSRIDVSFLAQEVLALKRRRLGISERDDSLLSVTSAASKSSLSSQNRPVGSLSAIRVPKSPFYSAIESTQTERGGVDQPPSAVDAAFALIRDLRVDEPGKVKSDEEILEALKGLQNELEE